MKEQEEYRIGGAEFHIFEEKKSMTNQEIDEQFDKLATYTNEYGYVHPIPKANELKAFIHKVIAERDEALKEKILIFNRTKHICRFNDGESKCECYYKAFEDILSLLE